jgi:hypothetical protein
MEEQLNRWKSMYELYPEKITRLLQFNILSAHNGYSFLRDVPDHLLPESLNTFYPTVTDNQELKNLFIQDIQALTEDLIQNFTLDYLYEHLYDLSKKIEELFKFNEGLLEFKMEGGKFTYKGRKYVIRNGLRSGKYILVKNKKVYLSQL